MQIACNRNAAMKGRPTRCVTTVCFWNEDQGTPGIQNQFAVVSGLFGRTASVGRVGIAILVTIGAENTDPTLSRFGFVLDAG